MPVSNPIASYPQVKPPSKLSNKAEIPLQTNFSRCMATTKSSSIGHEDVELEANPCRRSMRHDVVHATESSRHVETCSRRLVKGSKLPSGGGSAVKAKRSLAKLCRTCSVPVQAVQARLTLGRGGGKLVDLPILALGSPLLFRRTSYPIFAYEASPAMKHVCTWTPSQNGQALRSAEDRRLREAHLNRPWYDVACSEQPRVTPLFWPSFHEP